MSDSRAIHQPIDPDVRPLLDPEYVAFHDEYCQYLIPDDAKVWDGSARLRQPTWPVTESKPVQVGRTRDIDLGAYNIRVFEPESPRPVDGWPVFLWFHGGGWAVGDISSGNDMCALICQRAECVVISVGYRLAPEHPFPAAFDDSVDALKWVHSSAGAKELEINPARIAVGGTSAGGQLAASLVLKASLLSPPIDIKFQLLVVPVIDNTATVSTIWSSRKNAPWLTPARMQWYRKMYFTDETSASQWEASPNYAPASLLAASPKTWIAVSEQDLLSPEAKLYAEQLSKAWEEAGSPKKEVLVKEYEGSTHSIMALSAILTKGRQLLEDTANQAAEWFRS
ncbi:alpha/beta hydrolase fold-domain-containing protein [Xylariales sp. PMI_506]|nr:alpha/beta hydrolase fold-domain-containing protein [Xylariales sp. PMI_506]